MIISSYYLASYNNTHVWLVKYISNNDSFAQIAMTSTSLTKPDHKDYVAV